MHHARRFHKTLYIAVILTFAGTLAAAGDWPQFQGPDRNGISQETGLARSWPEEGPETLWSISLGEGFSSPAIRDGEVFILDRSSDGQDVLRCLSLETGKELWRYAYDAPGEVSHDGSRATPAVTETHVFTVGMMGDFYCFDRSTHKPLWNTNLLGAFGAATPKYGITQSPLLHGDYVIVAPQTSQAFVVAYDRATGEPVWVSESFGGLGYASPIVTTLAGVEQIVMLSAPNGDGGGAAGISLEDGAILWRYREFSCKNPIPNCTPLPDDRLFITGGYGAGSAVIQIGQSEGVFTVSELFTTQACGSQIHQPLLYENHLYVNSNGNRHSDGMLCLTLDGELLWRTRDDNDLPRFGRGNLLMAEGMIVSLDGRTGILHLVEASPEGYKELARAQVFDGMKMWAPMALSNGRLLVRSQEEMRCLNLRAPETK